MADRRLANRNWLPGDEQGDVLTWERVNTALLLDIREELRTLNRLLACPNFVRIPATLRQIRGNTSRLPVKRKGKKP